MIQFQNNFNFRKKSIFTGLIVFLSPLFLFNCSTSSNNQETTMSSPTQNRGLAGIVREEICQKENQFSCYIDGQSTCCRYEIASRGCPQKSHVPCGKDDAGKQLCCPVNKKVKCPRALFSGFVNAGETFQDLICNNDGKLVKICPPYDDTQYHCDINGRNSCCHRQIFSEVCDNYFGDRICNNDGKLVEVCPIAKSQTVCMKDGRPYCCGFFKADDPPRPNDDDSQGNGDEVSQ